MKNQRWTSSVAGLVAVWLASGVVVSAATTASWGPTAAAPSGPWGKAANWVGGVEPNGVDDVAYFTNNITVDANIAVTNKTVGTLQISDGLGATGSAGNSWIFNPNSAQTLTLQTASGSASINVAYGPTGVNRIGHRIGANQTLSLGSDLTINVAAGTMFGSQNALTSPGNKNLTVSGGGQAWFEATQSGLTGNMVVNNASLRAVGNGTETQPNVILFGGNLLMNNAVLVHSGDFTRTIGGGAGQVQFTGTSLGFSARGQANAAVALYPSTLNLNNNGSDIHAGSASVPPTTFNFNTDTEVGSAARLLTVANSLDLNGNTVTINAGPASGFNPRGPVVVTGPNGITGAGDLIVTGGALLAVRNGLTHTGTTTVNGGNLASGTASLPAGKIVLQNSGVLYASGLFNRTIGGGAGQIDIGSSAFSLGAYGGDLVVQLNGGTAQLNASTINSQLILNTAFSTGQIDFQNPINIDTAALTISAGQGGNAVTFAAGNYGSAYSIMAALSGTGSLIVGAPGGNGGAGGMVVLRNTSTYAGTTTIDGGSTTMHGAALWARETKGLTSANLTLKNGGILATYGTFNRTIGTGAGQVQWTATTLGGFAAVGGDLAVRLNGGTGSITVGAASTFASLVLGSEFSTHTVDFQNDLNVGGVARTISVAGSVEQKISGNISGASGPAISGSGFGTLVLTGNNSFGALSFGGSPNATLLKMGSATALGGPYSFTMDRGVIDLAGYSTANAINLTSRNSGNPNGQYYLQNSSTNTESVWNGNVTSSATTGLFGGRGDLRITGSVGTGTVTSMAKGGMGKLTLVGTAGTSAVNSSFTANSGALVLDYTSNNTDKFQSIGTGSLTLNACALTVLGNGSALTTATLPNFVAGTGQNTVTVTCGNNQNATLVLNACSRNGIGAAVDFNLVNTGSGIAAITTSTTTLYNGLLRDGANTRSGYATFNGGRTWATVSGSNVVGLPDGSYNPLTTANGNADVNGTQSIGATITLNSLRFNSGASTLTLNNGVTLTLGGVIGGILMTPNASGNATLDNVGTGNLVVSGNNDLLVHQYNPTYTLEIDATISGNNLGLSKVGPGLLYMNNAANSFSGPVRILGGTLRTDSINNAGASSSIGAGGATAGRSTVLAGGARFLYTGAGSTTDRDFVLNGDAVIDASGGGALTLNPQASTGSSIRIADATATGIPYNLTLQGSGVGIANGLVRLSNLDQAYGGYLAGSLIKKGAGTWTLNAVENLVHDLDVREGTVNLGHASNTLVDNAYVTVEGGTLGLGANSDKVGIVTLKSGAITGTGTLQGYRYDVQGGSISPALAGVVSALAKTTTNTVTLTGANTYLGDTLVQQGRLISTTQIAGDVTVTNGATFEARGTVGGNLTLASGAKLGVTLSASPTSLAVVGAVTLTGSKCDVKSSGGFATYTISAAQVTGVFTSVTPPFMAQYTPTTVIIGPSSGTLVTVH